MSPSFFPTNVQFSGGQTTLVPLDDCDDVPSLVDDLGDLGKMPRLI